MRKFIAGRVEVCLGYDFEEMTKYDAIEKCKELGPNWRLPNNNEIVYLCQNLCYAGSLDFWESTSMIGKLVSRRGSRFNQPVYWMQEQSDENTSKVYDSQFPGMRSIYNRSATSLIDCVLLAVRDI